MYDGKSAKAVFMEYSSTVNIVLSQGPINDDPVVAGEDGRRSK